MRARARNLIRRSSAGDRRDADREVAATSDAEMLERTITPEDRTILAACAGLTMTSAPRLLALVDAVRHIVRNEIPGDLAECGVWRGGSVLAMILTLQAIGAGDRHIHLYDTFEGMTRPTDRDTSPFDRPALETWDAAQAEGRRAWDGFLGEAFSEDGVRATLLASGYPRDRLHFHAGDVLETIPTEAPGRLGLLRLDTDWYASTRHELEHLYPRLSVGGVLIIDDYGHWEGARRAVDEYFGERPPLLHRIDYTGRIAIKTELRPVAPA